MAALPTVDQLPSFEEVCAFLKSETRQCIWFLPNQKRLCLCKITDKEDKEDIVQEALKLVQNVQKPGITAASRIEMLGDIAELCCCPRHHRSKMYGTGLKEKVGKAWNKKLKVIPTRSENKAASPSMTQTADKEPSLQVQRISPLRTFAKHQVHTEESMFERLCSPLDLRTGTKGSIYFYTHKATAFSGMIKIGYTCRTIASRLLDWEECGHGKPDLLDSLLDVRHPERVELLTHFQLLKVWHEIMWCKAHQRTHIEWFKVGVETAKTIASRWNEWMHKANPYDRRGNLLPVWETRCAALEKLRLPITAQTMLRFYEYDVGTLKRNDPVVEDDPSLKREETAVPLKPVATPKPRKLSKPLIPPKPEVRIKKEPKD